MMENISIEELLKRFKRNPPVNNLAIEDFNLKTGLELPLNYINFLKIANGGEGFIGNSYISLWKIEELQELNVAYQVGEYAPGLLLIGSDMGGEAFAFDMTTRPWPLVRVPFVGMSRNSIEILAADFRSFLEFLFKQIF